MHSAREYLKGLIDQGYALQKPQQNIYMANSALQVAKMYPSNASITSWKRNVREYIDRYLNNRPATRSIGVLLLDTGGATIDMVVNYLEQLYNNYVFWDSLENKQTIQQSQKRGLTAMYDVFISHANQDKTAYVDDLKKSLDKLNIQVFYDKDTLEWGDNWKNKILEGVKKAEFAIIVISDNFFGREWTEKELMDFLNRQNQKGQKIILPILHEISVEKLQEKYPAIADIQALDSSKYTCDEIALKFAAQLIKRLKA